MIKILFSLFLAVSAYAVLPTFPEWTDSHTPIFKLSKRFYIDDTPVNALVFHWPRQTGVSDGRVEFGLIDQDGHFERRGEGRYDSIVNFIKIEFSTRQGMKKLRIDGQGSVWLSDQVLGKVEPVYEQVTIRLESTESKIVGKDTDFGATIAEYIELKSPIQIRGEQITVIKSKPNREVDFGQVDKNGNWKLLVPGGTYRWGASPLGVHIGDSGTGHYLEMFYKSHGQLVEKVRGNMIQQIEVRGMRSEVTDRRYLPLPRRGNSSFCYSLLQ